MEVKWRRHRKNEMETDSIRGLTGNTYQHDESCQEVIQDI